MQWQKYLEDKEPQIKIKGIDSKQILGNILTI